MNPTGEVMAALVLAGEITLGTLVLLGLLKAWDWNERRKARYRAAALFAAEYTPKRRASVVPIHSAPVLRAGSNPPPTFAKPAPPPDPPRPPFP